MPILFRSFKDSPCLPTLKYMPKYSGNEFELRIGRCKIDEDKGEYTVKAENSYGKLEASAFLNVERKCGQPNKLYHVSLR